MRCALRSWVATALLLACAGPGAVSAYPELIQTDPTAPAIGDSVTIVVGFAHSNGCCEITSTRSIVDGRRIEIQIDVIDHSFEWFCPMPVSRTTRRIPLGVLAAGRWDLQVVHSLHRPGSGRRTVRDVAFEVEPRPPFEIHRGRVIGRVWEWCDAFLVRAAPGDTDCLVASGCSGGEAMWRDLVGTDVTLTGVSSRREDCGWQGASVHDVLCVEDIAVPVEPSTWGAIKTLYR